MRVVCGSEIRKKGSMVVGGVEVKAQERRYTHTHNLPL
jgi:hypothetical protein